MSQGRTVVGYVTAVAVAVLLLGSMTIPAVATQHDDDSIFKVELGTDGSATVTVRYAFNLDSDAERQAFRQLRDNETTQEFYRSRFTERMQRVATRAANVTGRTMAISDTRISFEIRDDGSTGLASLSVEWSGFASAQNTDLVVTEPFASGFEPDRRLLIHAPDGYEVSSVSPSPDTRNETTLEWHAGTNLEGFNAEFTTISTPTAPAESSPTPQVTTTSGGNGSGFGILSSFGAAVVLILLIRK